MHVGPGERCEVVRGPNLGGDWKCELIQSLRPLCHGTSSSLIMMMLAVLAVLIAVASGAAASPVHPTLGVHPPVFSQYTAEVS